MISRVAGCRGGRTRRWRGGRCRRAAGWCRGGRGRLGDWCGRCGRFGWQLELPAGVDLVGILESGAVGLGIAGVEFPQLRPLVGVADVGGGEIPQRVAGLDRDRAGWTRRGSPAGGVRGQDENPAGADDPAGFECAAVRLGAAEVERLEVVPALSVAEGSLGDAPQAVETLDRVADRRRRRIRYCWRRGGWGGWRDGARL